MKRQIKSKDLLLFLDEKKQKSRLAQNLAKISYYGENLSILPAPLKDFLTPNNLFLYANSVHVVLKTKKGDRRGSE